ncbi:MAG: hypothetical protein H0T84_06585 [Tatlockia sp.]|nr:hypothetical protein [Tatlockia sp.]
MNFDNFDKIRLGLFDYLCFLIPVFLRTGAAQLGPNINGVILTILFPLEFVLRTLASVVLTLCVTPLVLIIHFTFGNSFDEFIIPLITRKWRLMVQNEIKKTLAENNPVLSFKALFYEPEYYLLIFPRMTNFIIEQLNEQPSIKILCLEVFIPENSTIIKELSQNLKHILKLEAPSANPNINSFILSNSNIKHLHVNSNYDCYHDSFWEEELYKFFKLNRSLESLEGNVFPPEEGLLTIITPAFKYCY